MALTLPGITLDEFFTGVLGSLGNKNPSKNTLRFLAGWKNAESGKATTGTADFNPLNTTQEWANSTFFLCLQKNADGSCAFGVRNYANLFDGMAATVYVLTYANRYPSLVAALKNNDEAALGFPNGTPSPGVLSDLRTWVHGPASSANISGYVQNIFGGLDNGSLAMQWGGGKGAASGAATTLGNVGGALLSPGSAVGEALITLNQQFVVVNPFGAATPARPEVNNPIAVAFGAPALSWTSNPLDWLTTVGNTLVQDFVAIMLRLVLIVIGFIIVARIVMRVLPTEKVGEVAASSAEKVAPLFI